MTPGDPRGAQCPLPHGQAVLCPSCFHTVAGFDSLSCVYSFRLIIWRYTSWVVSGSELHFTTPRKLTWALGGGALPGGTGCIIGARENGNAGPGTAASHLRTAKPIGEPGKAFRQAPKGPCAADVRT